LGTELVTVTIKSAIIEHTSTFAKRPNIVHTRVSYSTETASCRKGVMLTDRKRKELGLCNVAVYNSSSSSLHVALHCSADCRQCSVVTLIHTSYNIYTL